MKASAEAALVRACLQYLALRGIPAWRQNSGAVAGVHKGRRRFVRFNTADGCSDILGLMPPAGRLLAVEVKQPGRKPTAKQAGFLDQVRKAGGLAIVASDLRELAAAVDAAMTRPPSTG